jgi:hypothetical protein
LGSHQRIASVGEIANTNRSDLGDPENYQCSCGKLLKECAFWKKVFIEMKKSYKDFSYNNFNLRLALKDAGFISRLQFFNLRYNFISDFRDYIYSKIPKYRTKVYSTLKRNIDLAEAILFVTGKDIFFDSSKNALRIKFLRQHLSCEFKVIHLIKDGRGVFDSCKRYRPHWSDRNAIMLWKKANNYIERALSYVEKANRYRLLYKNLVNNPEYELNKLCEFIGVEYTPNCLDFRDSDHHIIGNSKMRLGINNKIYNDEKWRESLSTEQIRLFERLSGRMNRRYGYSGE